MKNPAKNETKKKRLTRAQRSALLAWVAEGCSQQELEARAQSFKPAFTFSHQTVKRYRDKARVEIKKIKEEKDKNAIAAGYEQKDFRVQKLAELARLLERDIFGERLWLEVIKIIGIRTQKEIKFNADEVSQFRGVLDDIAKELGERVKRSELSGPGGGAIPVDMVERALKKIYGDEDNEL